MNLNDINSLTPADIQEIAQKIVSKLGKRPSVQVLLEIGFNEAFLTTTEINRRLTELGQPVLSKFQFGLVHRMIMHAIVEASLNMSVMHTGGIDTSGWMALSNADMNQFMFQKQDELSKLPGSPKVGMFNSTLGNHQHN